MDRDPRSRQQKPAGGPAARARKPRHEKPPGADQKRRSPGPRRAPGHGRDRADAAPGCAPAATAPGPAAQPAKGRLPPGRPHPPAPPCDPCRTAAQRRHRAVLGMLVVVGALALGVILSVNLLFKVSSFRIENTDGTTPADTGIYTEQQILTCSACRRGITCLAFPQRKVGISAQQPAVSRCCHGAVQIPNTVVIKVQPAKERFALEYGGQWGRAQRRAQGPAHRGRPAGRFDPAGSAAAGGPGHRAGSFMQLKSQGGAGRDRRERPRRCGRSCSRRLWNSWKAAVCWKRQR